MTLPLGHDPADLINPRGDGLLPRVLKDSHPLADTILGEMLTNTDLHDTAARLWLARDTAKIIAALPPTQWTSRIDQLTERLALPKGMLHMEVIEAAETWDSDPQGEALRHIRSLAYARSRETGARTKRNTQVLGTLSPVVPESRSSSLHRPKEVSRPRRTLRP